MKRRTSFMYSALVPAQLTDRMTGTPGSAVMRLAAGGVAGVSIMIVAYRAGRVIGKSLLSPFAI
ncbi:MAG: hypothetical protein ABW184_00105 [Sphingobium sp.]